MLSTGVKGRGLPDDEDVCVRPGDVRPLRPCRGPVLPRHEGDAGDRRGARPRPAVEFQEGRVSNNIYFSALVDTAVWGAELATAIAGSDARGHVYVVEPTGPFEDDPNVTNKRFPGNVTQSYRTRDALRVVGEVDDWAGHAPEVLKGMLDRLALLREQGLDVIED